jgi:hypothetical protein
MSIRVPLAPFACLFVAGCALPHHAVPGNPIGTASPLRYCPNDTVTAQYDVFGDQPCAAFSGGGCAALTPPTVGIGSLPVEFAERSFHAMHGEVTFVPRNDPVDVTFSVDPRPYGISYTGTAGTTVVRLLRGNIVTVRKLEGDLPFDQIHGVSCANGVPAYAATTVTIPAGDSPSLEARQVCNTGNSAIEVTLTGPTGTLPPQTLADGACAEVPAGLRAPVVVAVRSVAVGPAPRCTPTDTSQIPVAQTHVVLACPR